MKTEILIIFSSIFPFNYKEQKTRELIDRFNTIVSTPNKERLMEVGWGAISVRTEIYDLIKNEAPCPEAEISKISYMLDKLERSIP